MARRKQKWLSDEDSSGDSSAEADDRDEPFDPNDPDLAAERELFNNPGGAKRKRGREEAREDATYGVWADEQLVGASRGAGGGRKGRTDYAKAPAFVSAGASSSKAPHAPLDNLAPPLESAPFEERTRMIEADPEGEQEMELGDSDEDSSVAGDVEDEDEQMGDAEEEDYEDEDEDNLAPVPGLAASPPSAPPPVELPVLSGSSLGFAPRGLGAKGRGVGGGIGSRAGIGGGGGGGIGSSPAGGAGIGARAGLGSTSVTAGVGARLPAFASATSASDRPLGGIGSSASKAPAFAAGAGIGASAPGAESPMAGAATPRQGLGGAHRPPTSLVDALRAQLNNEATATAQSPMTGVGASSSTASSSLAGTPPPADAPRRSFLPTAAPAPARAPGKISAKEQQHFANLAKSGSVGMKMLEKMGWKAGSGLGANEQGIVTPIGEGQKLRKVRAGIAQGERSAGAIAEEARRLGKDPDQFAAERIGKGPKPPREEKPKKTREAWQQPRKAAPAKVKTEYKTYEELIAESGTGAQGDGVGVLVDLSGNALPSQSLSSLPAYGAGSADPTRLPELRHNLTLLTSTISASLAALAREGKGVEDRRAYLQHEERRVREAVEAQEHKMERLERVLKAVAQVREIEKETVNLFMAGGAEGLGPEVFLAPFNNAFDELYVDEDYQSMGLDEVVVGAIAPVIRRLFQHWDPLSEPTLAVAQLKRWKKLFLIDKHLTQLPVDAMDVDIYGSSSSAFASSAARRAEEAREMTPYESLMWTVWLPRVRSALNNVWEPTDPLPAVTLYTSWAPLLPAFLRDNVLDQLILPKLSKAISDWSPSSLKRGGAPLHSIVFPWLEHAGPRMDLVLEEAKRKVRSWLKLWRVSDGLPRGMAVWRDAIPSSDWDSILLKHVLPQLGAWLRESFIVNPRAQDVKPLEAALEWRPLLRSSMMSSLLEQGFFPQFLDALYTWLKADGVNFEQVAEWYSWWKSFFPEEILALSGVKRGFKKALELMNQAMALGDDAAYRLKRPDTSAPVSSSHERRHKSKSAPQPSVSAPTEEVTFRMVVEEEAAAANLVFVPTGKTDKKGHALFRVSKGVDGRSGVTVYLDSDVVWLQEGTEKWSPVGVAEMIRRASGA